MSFPARVKTLFFDIDGTITEDLSNTGEVGYFEYVFRDLLVKKHHLSSQKALSMVLNAEDKVAGKDPFLALAQDNLGISESELWEAIIRFQHRNLRVYADAVSLIKKLYTTKYGLYVTTNNTTNRALAKLACAGIADRSGSKYFKKIYGYDFTGFKKSSTDFYRKIFNDKSLHIEDTVIVGDDPVCDMEIPREIGVKGFIIINRKQREEVVIEKNGAYFVNNLKRAWDILVPEKQEE
jgi:FMN phosphatase YigB (HAD superfamily)